MPSQSRVVATCAATALALLVASAPGTAAPKRITGKLSKPGYTVIALTATGEGKTVRATPRFKLRPPARRVSLHLWGPDGFYAGPVVVGKQTNGRVAIVGVKAGAKLGKVEVNKRKGYAKVKPTLREKSLDRKRSARAKKGVPIGAGNFGFVRSKVPRKSPPGDLDADGVADPLDIDADGNLVIDLYEGGEAGVAAGRRSASSAQQGEVVTYYVRVLAINDDGSLTIENDCGYGGIPTRAPAWPPTSEVGAPEVGKVYEFKVEVRGPGDYTVLSVKGPIAGGCPASEFVPTVAGGLNLTLRDTLNAHVYSGDPAVFKSLVEQTLENRGILAFFDGGTNQKGTVELGCPGAPFCTAGGTGRFTTDYFIHAPPSSWPEFPECCDGEIRGGFLSHGATTDQIGAGTALNWLVTKNGEETVEFPTSLAGVFATVPALASYEDGASNRRDISYPVPPPYQGSPRDFFGPYEGPYTGLPVAPCPANGPAPCVDPGDAVVTFTFHRPQRESLTQAGEPGLWIDIRDLVYTVTLSKGIGEFFNFNTCEQSQMSTTDPNLTPTPAPGSGFFAGGGFLDPGDEADTDNTLSFSVNLTKCLADQGVSGSGETVGPGDNVAAWLGGGVRGADGSAGANQQLLFTLE